MSRKAATDFLVGLYDEMDGKTKVNGPRARKELDSLSDKEFAALMDRYEKGEEYPVYIVPVGQRPLPSVEKLMRIGEKRLDIKWRQRVWLPREHGGEVLSPIDYLILHLPVRRQSQRMDKKRSIPDNTSVLDQLTHQPTGPSKGSALSFSETQVLVGQGLSSSIEEFIRFRGGDLKGLEAMNNTIYQDGEVSLEQIESQTGGVRSKRNLSSILTAMHLKNNL